MSESDAAEFYAHQRQALASDSSITEKRMFGTTALCVNGKVAMFPWRENLVLKLPAERVDEMVGAGKGVLFDPGHGRTSKTWVALYPASSDLWQQLAVEALDFVGPAADESAKPPANLDG